MRTSEFGRQRTALERRQSELIGALHSREEIAIEKTADELDNIQLSAQRDLAVSRLHRESGLLRAVRAALARIGDGSYGMCLNCGEPISPKRLQAVPWAAYCVRCQEEADRGEVNDSSGFDLPDAA